ncbi:transporter, major facilitator family protein [Parvimonas sp. KA00067]|uniref:MFS transporter n=1 Tax=Parvimonas sp. KA00067 TaxID=1588755 RepID=UPI000797326F|nr:MFS transporter [Parvimonas sp. KA00067]KXB66326.1 transporter, major facilitator family protein [Parvimonas sp. KA00067]
MDIVKESRKQMIKLIMTTITGNFGSSILSFIIGLLILKKTESALNFGISQVIGPLVALVLVPFVGAVVDKYNKKIVIVIAQLFSIVSLLLYALSLNSNAETNLINTYMLLICLKVADQFLNNAFASSVKKVVCEEYIQKVKSFQQIASSGVYIISPVLAVFLLTKLELIYFVLLEAVIEFITILIVLFINFNLIKTEVTENYEEKKVLKMFVEGIKYIRNKEVLVFIIFFAMFINFIFASVSVGLPYVLINEIKISDYLYGIVNATFPVAMIVSSIILSMMKDIESPLEFSFKWIRGTAGVLLFLGIALLFKLSTFSYFIVFVIFAFGVNFVGNFVNTPMFVWFTKAVPHEYQGRVFSIIETGCQLLNPLGILFYSILFDNFKSSYIFIFSGLVLLVFVFVPYILKVDLKTKSF